MPGGQLENEVPDPVTGLLPSQKKLIVDCWDIVTLDSDANGIEFFIRLFSEHPKAKQYFPKLRNQSLDELRNDTTLIAHSQKVMTSITYLVHHLDDSQELVATVQTLARGHRDLGICAPEFKIVLDVLQSFMKDALKDKYDIFTERAWQICCDVIQTVVDAEMKT